MTGIELDYSDITEIFRENLKIENLVKTIQSIFLNYRYSSKIDYKPYFQRNYVWDDEKASYFIESILLGTEIPPLVLFQTKQANEVIDGRQRYETIQRFLNDRLILKEEGLKSLKTLAGKRYSLLDEEIKESFENTRLRILQCSVVNEPSLSEEKEDKIKKEIFRRYNSGIMSLQKEEIERAAFIHDELSNHFYKCINSDDDLFSDLVGLFLPKSKMKAQKRDKVNVLLTRIRILLTLPLVPIYSYAHGSSKSDIIRKYYYIFVYNDSPNETLNKFKDVIRVLKQVQTELRTQKHFLSESPLFYEVVFWALYIIPLEKFNQKEVFSFCNCIANADNTPYFWNSIDSENNSIEMTFEPTGSHYYKSINNRYRFISNYFSHVYHVTFDERFKNNESFKTIMDKTVDVDQYKRYKLNKSLPESVTIDDIVNDMQKSRFLIRPPYQRSEVTNVQKASYLLESIMLGIQIPPIFIYKRGNKVKEVIDGQQRLLTILGFLGKSYIDENGDISLSQKDRFRLNKLRILSELNGKNVDTVDEKYIDKIYDFPIDIVEIEQEQNPDFNEIDLFLRLNTKPYPIKENTFEMWNAYVDKDIIMAVKALTERYAGVVFRTKDSRMKNEELVTSLAYIDFKLTLEHSCITDVLNLYKRYGRISARIMSKESVTRTLSTVSNNNPSAFLQSIQNVGVFANKVLTLIDKDNSKINALFSHKRKGTQCKTDQNFYFLWEMLKSITIEDISIRKYEIFSKISQKFSILQNTPEDYTVEMFLNDLGSI